MKKNVSILCGGPSCEYDVSLDTARSFLANLDMDKYTPYIFYISKSKKALLYQSNTLYISPDENLKPLEKEILKLKDMYSNLLALHGEFGEDGEIQSILESLNIQFTGSDSVSSQLCMDKYKSAMIVKENLLDKDLVIPYQKLFTLEEIITSYQFTENICIKPNNKGSSVGVHLVHSKKELENALNLLKQDFPLNTQFLIQSLLVYDIEVSCGCLEKRNGEFIPLPPIEIIPKSSSFFDYKAKYTKGCSLEITPPEHISKELSEKISKLTIELHRVLGCRLYSRSDFLIKENTIYYLETNTLPGMTTTSLLPQEAKAMGMSFPKLIDFFIENS